MLACECTLARAAFFQSEIGNAHQLEEGSEHPGAEHVVEVGNGVNLVGVDEVVFQLEHTGDTVILHFGVNAQHHQVVGGIDK